MGVRKVWREVGEFDKIIFLLLREENILSATI